MKRPVSVFLVLVLCCGLLALASCEQPPVSPSDPSPASDLPSVPEERSESAASRSDIPLTSWPEPASDGAESVQDPSSSGPAPDASSVPAQESSKSGTSSVPSSAPHSESSSPPAESSGDEPDVSAPPFAQYVDVPGNLRVGLPAGWTHTSSADCPLNASDPGQSLHLTVDTAPIDEPKGLTDALITESMLSALKSDFPASSGYSVSSATVRTRSGEHPAVTIIRSDGTEPYRQQAYFLRGSAVITVTVFTHRSADAAMLWKFIELL